MTHDQDPFDILSGHDPVDRASVPDADSPQGQELLRQIIATSKQARPARKRRLVVAVAAIVVAMLVITAATTWYGRTDDVTEIAVACFAEVSLDSDRVGTTANGAPAVDVCVDPWEEAVLTNPDVEPGDVPPLTACVSDVGSFWVFPTDDRNVCEQLGLAVPSPNQSTGELEDIADAQDDIIDWMLSAPCQPLDDAEGVIRGILDSHGLIDWNIQRQPGHPDRPCASIGYDIPGQTVILVPIPGG